MAFKHALVVDDSKSARIALKRMLEKHHLIVDFAETGEEALEFLQSQQVDVIFMDHEMPGMDGLEAVTVIKSDPRTAMVPVMMYTAREGEVYVGQARALGAIGVLPKQVHPAELFDVLLKLGLVEERRARPRPPPADAPAAATAGPAATSAAPSIAAAGAGPSPEPAAESAAGPPAGPPPEYRGFAVESLVERILEDQHTTLRADILSSHREFAKEVAREIVSEQEQARKDEWLQQYETDAPRTISLGAAAAGFLLLMLPIIVLFVLFWQARGERDAALEESARLSEIVDQQAQFAADQSSELMADFDYERQLADSRYAGFVEALQWGINDSAGRPYDGLAFDDAQLNRLRELLLRLEGIGFTGTVRMASHLGEFCVVTDADGAWQLAPPDLRINDCDRFGHPLDDSVSVSQRQSVSFANFLATSPVVNGGQIEVEVVAHDRRGSERRYPFPATIATAGDWNALATLNNRVEYTLLPTEP
jgi:CheY-like chemotaxis protein